MAEEARSTVSETAGEVLEPMQAASADVGRPLRASIVGISTSAICGVHDHSVVLADELNRENAVCSLHWLSRDEGSLRATRAQIGDWADALVTQLEGERPDAILLAYSVFEYSHRGLPLFVRPVLSSLRRTGVPVIAVLHELAYPWRRQGWRGKVWAFSQRVALISVMRAASAVIVTADFQAEWLASRRWLARRSVAVAPVFSNLPPPTPSPRPQREGKLIGLFGYSYESIARSVVLDALRLLRDRGLTVKLALLGAPGRPSSSADAWLAEAAARDLPDMLSFSGALPAQALSDLLAGCDALLFADSGGPSSRKGSLAAALASGRPVVAIDGPRRWSEVARSGAADVVAPSPRALADAIGAVLGDERLGEELGARGRAFAEERMGVAVTAKAFTTLLGDVAERRTP